MFASSGALLLLDQWSKTMVRRRIPDRAVSWDPLLRIRYVANRRCAYRRRHARAALTLAWLAALLSVIALRHSGGWFQSGLAELGVGLALGGAAGNLADILRFGSVGDFIDLRWWPVFNLADVAIVMGLLAAFWPFT